MVQFGARTTVSKSLNLSNTLPSRPIADGPLLRTCSVRRRCEGGVALVVVVLRRWVMRGVTSSAGRQATEHPLTLQKTSLE